MPRRAKKTQEETLFDVEVGKRVERLRVDRDVTQVEMAKAIRVIPAMLYAYEVGQTRCPPFRLRMIAGFLGIEVGELIPEIEMAKYSPARPKVAFRSERRAKRMIELSRRAG